MTYGFSTSQKMHYIFFISNIVCNRVQKKKNFLLHFLLMSVLQKFSPHECLAKILYFANDCIVYQNITCSFSTHLYSGLLGLSSSWIYKDLVLFLYVAFLMSFKALHWVCNCYYHLITPYFHTSSYYPKNGNTSMANFLFRFFLLSIIWSWAIHLTFTTIFINHLHNCIPPTPSPTFCVWLIIWHSKWLMNTKNILSFMWLYHTFKIY